MDNNNFKDDINNIDNNNTLASVYDKANLEGDRNKINNNADSSVISNNTISDNKPNDISTGENSLYTAVNTPNSTENTIDEANTLLQQERISYTNSLLKAAMAQERERQDFLSNVGYAHVIKQLSPLEREKANANVVALNKKLKALQNPVKEETNGTIISSTDGDGFTVQLSDGTIVKNVRTGLNNLDALETSEYAWNRKSYKAQMKQLELAAKMYGISIKDVTKEMVFNVGRWQQQQNANMLQGKPYETFDKNKTYEKSEITFGDGVDVHLKQYGVDRYGRPLYEVYKDGVNMTEMFALTPEINADYVNYTKYRDQNIVDEATANLSEANKELFKDLFYRRDWEKGFWSDTLDKVQVSYDRMLLSLTNIANRMVGKEGLNLTNAFATFNGLHLSAYENPEVQSTLLAIQNGASLYRKRQQELDAQAAIKHLQDGRVFHAIGLGLKNAIGLVADSASSIGTNLILLAASPLTGGASGATAAAKVIRGLTKFSMALSALDYTEQVHLTHKFNNDGEGLSIPEYLGVFAGFFASMIPSYYAGKAIADSFAKPIRDSILAQYAANSFAKNFVLDFTKKTSTAALLEYGTESVEEALQTAIERFAGQKDGTMSIDEALFSAETALGGLWGGIAGGLSGGAISAIPNVVNAGRFAQRVNIVTKAVEGAMPTSSDLKTLKEVTTKIKQTTAVFDDILNDVNRNWDTQTDHDTFNTDSDEIYNKLSPLVKNDKVPRLFLLAFEKFIDQQISKLEALNNGKAGSTDIHNLSGYQKLTDLKAEIDTKKKAMGDAIVKNLEAQLKISAQEATVMADQMNIVHNLFFADIPTDASATDVFDAIANQLAVMADPTTALGADYADTTEKLKKQQDLQKQWQKEIDAEKSKPDAQQDKEHIQALERSIEDAKNMVVVDFEAKYDPTKGYLTYLATYATSTNDNTKSAMSEHLLRFYNTQTDWVKEITGLLLDPKNVEATADDKDRHIILNTHKAQRLNQDNYFMSKAEYQAYKNDPKAYVEQIIDGVLKGDIKSVKGSFAKVIATKMNNASNMYMYSHGLGVNGFKQVQPLIWLGRFIANSFGDVTIANNNNNQKSPAKEYLEKVIGKIIQHKEKVKQGLELPSNHPYPYIEWIDTPSQNTNTNTNNNTNNNTNKYLITDLTALTKLANDIEDPNNKTQFAQDMEKVLDELNRVAIDAPKYSTEFSDIQQTINELNRCHKALSNIHNDDTVTANIQGYNKAEVQSKLDTLEQNINNLSNTRTNQNNQTNQNSSNTQTNSNTPTNQSSSFTLSINSLDDLNKLKEELDNAKEEDIINEFSAIEESLYKEAEKYVNDNNLIGDVVDVYAALAACHNKLADVFENHNYTDQNVENKHKADLHNTRDMLNEYKAKYRRQNTSTPTPNPFENIQFNSLTDLEAFSDKLNNLTEDEKKLLIENLSSIVNALKSFIDKAKSEIHKRTDLKDIDDMLRDILDGLDRIHINYMYGDDDADIVFEEQNKDVLDSLYKKVDDFFNKYDGLNYKFKSVEANDFIGSSQLEVFERDLSDYQKSSVTIDNAEHVADVLKEVAENITKDINDQQDSAYYWLNNLEKCKATLDKIFTDNGKDKTALNELESAITALSDAVNNLSSQSTQDSQQNKSTPANTRKRYLIGSEAHKRFNRAKQGLDKLNANNFENEKEKAKSAFHVVRDISNGLSKAVVKNKKGEQPSIALEEVTSILKTVITEHLDVDMLTLAQFKQLQKFLTNIVEQLETKGIKNTLSVKTMVYHVVRSLNSKLKNIENQNSKLKRKIKAKQKQQLYQFFTELQQDLRSQDVKSTVNKNNKNNSDDTNVNTDVIDDNNVDTDSNSNSNDVVNDNNSDNSNDNDSNKDNGNKLILNGKEIKSFEDLDDVKDIPIKEFPTLIRIVTTLANQVETEEDYDRIVYWDEIITNNQNRLSEEDSKLFDEFAKAVNILSERFSSTDNDNNSTDTNSNTNVDENKNLVTTQSNTQNTITEDEFEAILLKTDLSLEDLTNINNYLIENFFGIRTYAHSNLKELLSSLLNRAKNQTERSTKKVTDDTLKAMQSIASNFSVYDETYANKLIQDIDNLLNKNKNKNKNSNINNSINSTDENSTVNTNGDVTSTSDITENTNQDLSDGQQSNNLVNTTEEAPLTTLTNMVERQRVADEAMEEALNSLNNQTSVKQGETSDNQTNNTKLELSPQTKRLLATQCTSLADYGVFLKATEGKDIFTETSVANAKMMILGNLLQDLSNLKAALQEKNDYNKVIQELDKLSKLVSLQLNTTLNSVSNETKNDIVKTYREQLNESIKNLKKQIKIANNSASSEQKTRLVNEKKAYENALRNSNFESIVNEFSNTSSDNRKVKQVLKRSVKTVLQATTQYDKKVFSLNYNNSTSLLGLLDLKESKQADDFYKEVQEALTPSITRLLKIYEQYKSNEKMLEAFLERPYLRFLLHRDLNGLIEKIQQIKKEIAKLAVEAKYKPEQFDANKKKAKNSLIEDLNKTYEEFRAEVSVRIANGNLIDNKASETLAVALGDFLQRNGTLLNVRDITKFMALNGIQEKKPSGATFKAFYEAKNIGLPMGTIDYFIGLNFLEALGVKENKEAKAIYTNQIALSSHTAKGIGTVGLLVLKQMDIVTITSSKPTKQEESFLEGLKKDNENYENMTVEEIQEYFENNSEFGEDTARKLYTFIHSSNEFGKVYYVKATSEEKAKQGKALLEEKRNTYAVNNDLAQNGFSVTPYEFDGSIFRRDAETSEHDKERIQRENDTPFRLQLTEPILNFFKDASIEDHMRILSYLGYVDKETEEYQNMLLFERITQDSINNTVLREYVAFLQALDLQGLDLYLNFMVIASNRLQIQSSNINPQTVKLHRFMFDRVQADPKLYTLDINNDEHMAGYMFAVTQAFGLGSDKMSYDEIKEAFDKIVNTKDLTKTILPAIKEGTLVDELNKILGENAVSANDVKGAFGHLLRALESIEAYNTAIKNEKTTFVNYLTAEQDATTSGTAIRAATQGIFANDADVIVSGMSETLEKYNESNIKDAVEDLKNTYALLTNIVFEVNGINDKRIKAIMEVVQKYNELAKVYNNNNTVPLINEEKYEEFLNNPFNQIGTTELERKKKVITDNNEVINEAVENIKQQLFNNVEDTETFAKILKDLLKDINYNYDDINSFTDALLCFAIVLDRVMNDENYNQKANDSVKDYRQKFYKTLNNVKKQMYIELGIVAKDNNGNIITDEKGNISLTKETKDVTLQQAWFIYSITYNLLHYKFDENTTTANGIFELKTPSFVHKDKNFINENKVSLYEALIPQSERQSMKELCKKGKIHLENDNEKVSDIYVSLVEETLNTIQAVNKIKKELDSSFDENTIPPVLGALYKILGVEGTNDIKVIAKKLRNLAKPGVMTFSYMAALYNIRRELNEEVAKKMFIALREGNNEAVTDMFNSILEKYIVTYGKEHTRITTTEQLVEVLKNNLPMRLKVGNTDLFTFISNMFNREFSEFYGNAMKNKLGYSRQSMETLREGFQAQTNMYLIIADLELKNYIDSHKKPPTSKVYKSSILGKEKVKNLYPSVNTNTGSSFTSVTTERKPQNQTHFVKEDLINHNATRFTLNATTGNIVFKPITKRATTGDNSTPDNSSASFDLSSEKGDNVTLQGYVEQLAVAFAVAPVIDTQSTDASMLRDTLEKLYNQLKTSTIPIHDAIVALAQVSFKVNQIFNTEFMNSVNANSTVQQIVKLLDKSVQYFEDNKGTFVNGLNDTDKGTVDKVLKQAKTSVNTLRSLGYRTTIAKNKEQSEKIVVNNMVMTEKYSGVIYDNNIYENNKNIYNNQNTETKTDSKPNNTKTNTDNQTNTNKTQDDSISHDLTIFVPQEQTVVEQKLESVGMNDAIYGNPASPNNKTKLVDVFDHVVTVSGEINSSDPDVIQMNKDARDLLSTIDDEIAQSTVIMVKIEDDPNALGIPVAGTTTIASSGNREQIQVWVNKNANTTKIPFVTAGTTLVHEVIHAIFSAPMELFNTDPKFRQLYHDMLLVHENAVKAMKDLYETNPTALYEIFLDKPFNACTKSEQDRAIYIAKTLLGIKTTPEASIEATVKISLAEFIAMAYTFPKFNAWLKTQNYSKVVTKESLQNQNNQRNKNILTKLKEAVKAFFKYFFKHRKFEDFNAKFSGNNPAELTVVNFNAHAEIMRILKDIQIAKKAAILNANNGVINSISNSINNFKSKTSINNLNDLTAAKIADIRKIYDACMYSGSVAAHHQFIRSILPKLPTKQNILTDSLYLTKVFIAAFLSDTLVDTMPYALRLLGAKYDGFWQVEFADFFRTNKDEASLILKRLSAEARHADSTAQLGEGAVWMALMDMFKEEGDTNNPEKFFAKKFTIEQRTAITRVIIQSDLQALLTTSKRSIADVKTLLKDKVARDKEIQRIKTELQDLIKQDIESYTAYAATHNKKQRFSDKAVDKALSIMYAQASDLGRYITTGEGHEALALNAYNINTGKIVRHAASIVDKQSSFYKDLQEIDGVFRVLSSQANSKTRQQLIDELATLESMQYIADKDINEIVNMPDNQVAIFSNIYGAEMAKLKRTSYPSTVVKGYYRHLVNNDVELTISNRKPDAEMRKNGYEYQRSIKHSTTLEANDLRIYKRKRLVSRKRRGTSISFTGESFTETDIERLTGFSLTSEMLHDPANVNSTIELAHKTQINLLNAMTKNSYNTQISNRITKGLVCAVKGTGVCDYKFQVTAAEREALMEENLDGIMILAKTNRNIVLREEGIRNNDKLFKHLLSEYDVKLDELTYDNKRGVYFDEKGNSYVEFSADSKNTEYADLYRQLPNKTRRLIEDRVLAIQKARQAANMTMGHVPFLVRESWLPYLTGIQDASVIDLKWLQNIGYTTKRNIVLVENIIKAVASLTKVAIVIKTPAVLLGNIASNFTLALARGENPIEVLREYFKNIKHLKEYINTNREIAKNKVKIDAGLDLTGELAIHNRSLQHMLVTNPLHPLMKAGLYQNVVEDLLPEDVNDINIVQKGLNKMMSVLPEKAQDFAKQFYFAKGSVGYNALFIATQYSDFVARATDYSLAMRKPTPAGMTRVDYKNQIINEVLERYINYDKPQSKQIQYLNDIGLIMFTKFFKRIQRVIFDVATKHPVHAALFLASQIFFIDSEDIFEQHPLVKGLLPTLQSPIGNLETTITPPIFNILSMFK